MKLLWLTSLMCVRNWCVIHQTNKVNDTEIYKILKKLLMMRTEWGGLSSSDNMKGILQKAWILNEVKIINVRICFSVITESLISAKTISKNYVCNKITE